MIQKQKLMFHVNKVHLNWAQRSGGWGGGGGDIFIKTHMQCCCVSDRELLCVRLIAHHVSPFIFVFKVAAGSTQNHISSFYLYQLHVSSVSSFDSFSLQELTTLNPGSSQNLVSLWYEVLLVFPLCLYFNVDVCLVEEWSRRLRDRQQWKNWNWCC